jgi:hypothetical protein
MIARLQAKDLVKSMGCEPKDIVLTYTTHLGCSRDTLPIRQ